MWVLFVSRRGIPFSLILKFRDTKSLAGGGPTQVSAVREICLPISVWFPSLSSYRYKSGRALIGRVLLLSVRLAARG